MKGGKLCSELGGDVEEYFPLRSDTFFNDLGPLGLSELMLKIACIGQL